MTSHPTSQSDSNYTQRHDSIQRVLWVTLALNWLVAAGKIILGSTTGLLAISADGFHSLTDGAGNIAGLVANWAARRPADETHPYGHQRFETLAALFIGALLLFTAYEIGRGAIERLQVPANPEIHTLVFVIMGATLFINIGVNRYQVRAGQRLQSPILLADAGNTRADIFVTGSVLISTAVVGLTGWGWLDTVAALVVVVLIAHTAWGILRQTGRVLVDTAPYTPDELRGLLADMPNVQAVRTARSRGTPANAHIDLNVMVDPALTTEQTQTISNHLRQRLKDNLPGVNEVAVVFETQTSEQSDPVQLVTRLATALGMAAHEVALARSEEGLILELHVEVAPDLSLEDAHTLVEQFEAQLHERLTGLTRIVTHIEPASPTAMSTVADNAPHIEAQARAALLTEYPTMNWHAFATRPLDDGYALSLHVELPPDLPITHAHALAELAETTLRTRIPDLSRVTIHTEPRDH